MMDGRVKTLHPAVHGGLLALRDNADHVAAMDTHDIGPIDLVVVNLYPFEETLKRGAAYAEMIENIDIGGPAMIRSAAKNHGFVNVVVDVEDYDVLLADLEANDGHTTYALRQRLAQTAYARTAAYDTAVSTWMASQIDGTPRRATVGGTLAQTLRYGENPHQQAAFYTDGTARPGVATATQHQVVIAPSASDEAKAMFAAKKNLRLLTTGGMADPMTTMQTIRQVSGGYLMQDKDNGHIAASDLKVVVGVGAGQMSRLDSALIAATKAERMAEALGLPGSLAKGAAVASDAFFPFADGLLEAAAAGASCVIQPGGSMRDDEVIAAADEAGLAMVFTGMRHFRH